MVPWRYNPKATAPLLRSLAECREQQYLRAIAHLNEQVDAPPSSAQGDIRAWLGNGRLALTLLPEDQTQQPYQGMIELSGPTLEDNLADYFATSEQLPTRIFFAHTPTQVTGLCLQRLPNRDLATEIEMETHDEAWHTLNLLADTVTAEELSQHSAEQLLRKLFAEYPCRLHPSRKLAFQCTCSRAKTDHTLELVPPEEIDTLLKELGQIEVSCEFCGHQYLYDAIDIKSLRSNLASRPDATLH